jgi:hypothetical protein
MGTGSFPGVKKLGRGVDHPHLSIAEVKEEVEIYVYSFILLWVFVACSREKFMPLVMDKKPKRALESIQ